MSLSSILVCALYTLHSWNVIIVTMYGSSCNVSIAFYGLNDTIFKKSMYRSFVQCCHAPLPLKPLLNKLASIFWDAWFPYCVCHTVVLLHDGNTWLTLLFLTVWVQIHLVLFTLTLFHDMVWLFCLFCNLECWHWLRGEIESIVMVPLWWVTRLKFTV